MALASILQDSFAGGMYRGRRSGPTTAYDIVNGLLNSDQQVYRRGGSAYQSTSDAGATLRALADVQLAVGQRTIAASSAGFYVLDVDDATPIAFTGAAPRALSRPAGVGGMVVFPGDSASSLVGLAYAGSRKTSGYATGTVTVTNGSVTVTGVGTSWSANVDPGMIFGVGTSFGIVLNVASNTSLTLTAPWAGTTAAGAVYAMNPKLGVGSTVLADYGVANGDQAYLAAVGASPRLLICAKQRVYFSARNDPFTFAATDYHELPAGAAITGATAIGDTAIIFTTAGVWAIENMSLDPVDAYGNIQMQVSQLNEIVLWGDAGITTWNGAIVVPAVDDVYLMPLGGSPIPITGGRGTEWDDGIRVLYRSYVRAGYAPGTATVHRGHLFLPIVNGTTWVDTLVCNLSAGFVWSRFAGHAADIAYAQRVSAATRTPKLLGISGQRILDLTGVFDPTSGNAVEADGTISDCVITTRDFPLGANQPGFAKNARLRYELVDGGTPDPTVTVAFSSDQDAGAFTTLTDKGLQGGGTGGAVSDGSKYNWWLVAKRRERLRLRITVAGASASFVLRSVELLLRPSGKQ